jgi:hypothetical protein
MICEDENLTRRKFLKKAVYSTPKIVMLGAIVNTQAQSSGYGDGYSDGTSGSSGNSNNWSG